MRKRMALSERPQRSFSCTQVKMRKKRVLLFGLGIGFAVAFLAGLGLGAMTISPAQCLAILASKFALRLPIEFDAQQALIFFSIRLPRVLGGSLVGAGLALAGAAMQGLFRNPLADPGLTGVSSGAAVGAALFIVLSPLFNTSLTLLPCAAFCGALMLSLFAYRLAQGERGTVISTLLLAGIAFNSLCGAGVGLLSFVATDTQLRNLTFWSLGSLGGITWKSLGWLAFFILPAMFLLLNQQRVLNVLLLGEAEAGHLGLSVEKGKRIILLCTALIVGVSVSFTGMIAFVGLVVPHLLRLLGGADHRFLLPGSALLGASLLVAADTVARLILMPAELPIGIVTAMVGAPFFLWLLRRESRRRLH